MTWAGSTGTLIATQIFFPYGAMRYQSGTMPTSYGYTGQRSDPSGLLYYGARYYDPMVGQFISVDTVQGPNRYAYVGGNPTTLTDPSGQFAGSGQLFVDEGTNSCGTFVNTGSGCSFGTPVGSPPVDWNSFTHDPVVNFFTGSGDIWNDVSTLANPTASFQDKLGAVVNGTVNLGVDLFAAGVGKSLVSHAAGAAIDRLGLRPVADALNAAKARLAQAVTDVTAQLSHAVGDLLDKAASALGLCGANSFAGTTAVATPSGSQAIDTLTVGDQVLAYDGTTGTTKAEPVQQVFINHDTNLVDVTLAPVTTTSTAKTQPTSQKHHDAKVASHGSQAPPETLHTTSEHPFLTTDRGFVDAIHLRVGEPVQQLDGSVGVVVAVKVVAGEATRYNLTVQELHTYAVGTDQWVVHNCDTPGDNLPFRQPGDKTRGVFVSNGQQTDLISGKGGPASFMSPSTPGMVQGMAVRDHVEAQAAALMRQQGLTGGTLYINNTPCGGPMGCNSMLAHMLPEGSTLTVYYTDALNGITNWQELTFTGLSDSLWVWPFP